MKTSFASGALLGLSLLVAGAQLPAQASSTPSRGTVSGRLFDGQTQEPIPHSNVIVLRASDGRFVKSVATDANGHFRATGLPLGCYIVRTTVLGYHAIKPAVTLHTNRPQHALGTVVMVPLQMSHIKSADKVSWAKRSKPVASLETRRTLVRVRS